MRVRLGNPTGATINVPPPFDVDIAAAGTKDLDVHLRDIQEYRQNPARVDWLREIEQMVKDGRLTITVLSRDTADWDLEELLLANVGGAYKRSGVFTTPGAAPIHTIPITSGTGDAMPTAAYAVKVTLANSGAPVPYEVANLTTTTFDVVLAAPWGGPGDILWEISWPQ